MHADYFCQTLVKLIQLSKLLQSYSYTLNLELKRLENIAVTIRKFHERDLKRFCHEHNRMTIGEYKSHGFWGTSMSGFLRYSLIQGQFD